MRQNTSTHNLNFDFTNVLNVKPYYALDYVAPEGMGFHWLIGKNDNDLRYFLLGQEQIQVHLVDNTDKLILKNNWGYATMSLGQIFDMVECDNASDNLAYQKLYDFLAWELSATGKGIMPGLPADFVDEQGDAYGYGVCVHLAPGAKCTLSGRYFTSVIIFDEDSCFIADGREYDIVNAKIAHAYIAKYNMVALIGSNCYANSWARITHLPVDKGGYPVLWQTRGIPFTVFPNC